MITRTIRQARNTLGHWALEAGVRHRARQAALVLAAFCLSAGALEQGALPLAVGLVWVCHGPEALLAAAGAAVGYWIFWGRAGVQGLCCTAIALLGALALGKRRISREVPLLIPSLGMLTVSAVGLGFQLFAADTTPVLLYLLRVALGGGIPWLFSAAHRTRDPLLGWLSWGAGVLALAQLAPVHWLGLGFVAAGAAAAGGSFPCGAVTGLAVDLAAVTPIPVTAVTVLGWLLRLIPGLPRSVRILSPACVGLLLMRFWGQWDLAILPGLLLGGLLGCCLRTKPVPPRGHTGVAQVRLELAAGMLERVCQLLPRTQVSAIDTNALLERAVSDACGGCAARNSCPDREAMGRLPGGLLSEPLLTARELPVVCRKSGRLLQELRRAQLRLRSMQAERHRQEEYRLAVLQQYRFLSVFLQGLSDRLARREWVRPLQYTPQVQVYGNRPHPDNGDRCLYFSGVEDKYYVLLCDGMGTGPEAVREGNTAGELLRQMLQCGFPAEHALQSLNSICVLTDRGGTATVDLAELSLETGRATLYKWGAAPSWLVSSRGGEKLGAGGIPPGLGMEQEKGASCSVTLRQGQLLLLVSDGLPQKDIPQLCRDWGSAPAARLAEAMLGQPELGDDATVVTIRLLPAKQ